ncbi:MAG: PQQ-binding-like beta-propeller repeat protein [Thermoleophilaceae bacterium]
MLRALVTLVAALAAAAGHAAPSGAADWPTYHGDNARTGVASSPALGQLSRDWSKKVDGNVYASPLIASGRVVVATENNSLYAFDGKGKQLWRRHIGTPVSAGSLPCGNIDPSGITGTPAIDARSGTVYAVVFLRPFRHQLVAINLKNGKLRWRRSIDGKGMDPRVEQERGALVISQGRVYVPWGGLFGDCGDFHGGITSRTLSGRGLRSYKTPAHEAGMWAPAGLQSDSKGNIYGTTGNGDGNGHFGFESSVLRFTPTLRRSAFWAPRDWQALSAHDTDVGSLPPTLLNGGLVFQSGKNGIGYLLSSKLGGIGGEVFSARVCGAAFGGTAYQAPLVYVPCTDGLAALRVQGQRFSVAWRRTGFNAGPPIVAGGAVWTIDRDSGALHGYDAATGRDKTSVDLGGAIGFPTPAAAGNLLVAPARDSVAAYRGL